jgi:hypothetical protein
MAGLVPAIHVFAASKAWMPGNAGKFTQPAHAWLRAGHDMFTVSSPR